MKFLCKLPSPRENPLVPPPEKYSGYGSEITLTSETVYGKFNFPIDSRKRGNCVCFLKPWYASTVVI